MESNQHYEYIRHLYVELLAWMIWKHVSCKLEDRREVDWYTAVAYADCHQDKLNYLVSVTSPTISTSAFHHRFLDMVQNAINEMITNRAQWFSSTYYQ